MKTDNPTKAGNFKDVDATQSTEWGLRCLSHQTNELTFELTNLKTNRAHKLIFTGSGSETTGKESGWTSGFYQDVFETNFPANFENFNETFAFLTPGCGKTGNTHLFRIGWLAAIEINQPPGEGFRSWHLYGNCRIEYGSGERKNGTGSKGHAVTVLAWARI